MDASGNLANFCRFLTRMMEASKTYISDRDPYQSRVSIQDDSF